MTALGNFPPFFLTAAEFKGLPVVQTKDIIRVGGWSLDAASGEISRGEIRRRLEPKTLDLLLLLARSPSRVFSREEIFAAIWPDVTVGDDTLARAVSKLRKALDDDPKNPRIIETIPKRGYRLIDAVARDPAPQDAKKTPGFRSLRRNRRNAGCAAAGGRRLCELSQGRAAGGSCKANDCAR